MVADLEQRVAVEVGGWVLSGITQPKKHVRQAHAAPIGHMFAAWSNGGIRRDCTRHEGTRDESFPGTEVQHRKFLLGKGGASASNMNFLRHAGHVYELLPRLGSSSRRS